MSGKNLTLQDLPLEILAHILKFVGNSSFYSFQSVNKHFFFEILSSIVKSKVISSEVLAKKRVEIYKKTASYTTLTRYEKNERE